MNPPSSANPQRTLLRMGSTTGQRMAEPTGSQCRQCQHSGEPVALLRDRFEVSICWRRAQRMKASDAPQQECCPSGLPAHRGLAEPSEHSVTVMLESPDKCQVPTKDCPCPNHPPLSSGCLTHGTSFKLCFLYISFSASASRSSFISIQDPCLQPAYGWNFIHCQGRRKCHAWRKQQLLLRESAG